MGAETSKFSKPSLLHCEIVEISVFQVLERNEGRGEFQERIPIISQNNYNLQLTSKNFPSGKPSKGLLAIFVCGHQFDEPFD